MYTKVMFKTKKQILKIENVSFINSVLICVKTLDGEIKITFK